MENMTEFCHVLHSVMFSIQLSLALTYYLFISPLNVLSLVTEKSSTPPLQAAAAFVVTAVH